MATNQAEKRTRKASGTKRQATSTKSAPKRETKEAQSLPVVTNEDAQERLDAAHQAGQQPHANLIDHSYLQEEQFRTVAETLQRNLCTSVALYLKFKKFHWDIRGRLFRELHLAYDEMAAEVFASIDEIAERLVMLGGSPSAAPVDIDRYSTVRVPTETIHDARLQLEELVADHTVITRALREDSERCDEAEDPATADLYNGLLLTHDKHRWMLQATLDDGRLD